MRPIIKSVILAGALAVFAVVALKGAAILIPTGTWAPQTNLSSARANGSAALLQDGRVLITGGDSGSGPVATADFFAADGTVSAAPPMVNARSKHVSVTLQDGCVLVAGGITAGGSATNTAEIYDPAANSWTSIGTGMTEARSGATAALLPDGRVVIAGGQNGSSVSSTIEIFDPVAGNFSFVGTMSSPRTQHGMAVLQDGRVIITGGSNGTAPVASTDILDLVAGTISAGPNLAVARFGHTATTLLNGQVVIIGGNNGNADPAQIDVTPAELFDPTAGTFTTLAANLATPREGHLASLLPNNNSVLVAGGTSGGTATTSAELFTPQESSEGVWTYGFASTGSMTTARLGATGSANQVTAPSSVMQRNGVLLLAGGSDANSNALNSTEAYGYATIQTDQSDYPPGATVVITGSGWKPGETVTLSLVESPLTDTHGPFTAVADASGNIVNTQFSPDSYDAAITFTLTAVGQSSGSQAQTKFTDAVKQYEATISPTTDSAGHAATSYTVTIKNDVSSTNDISSATIAVPSGYSSVVPGTITTSPTGLHWTASLASGVITLTANTGPDHITNGQSVTLALTATAPCAVGAYTWTTATSGNFTLIGSQPTVTISGSCTVPTTLVLNSVTPNSVPFGSSGSVTFTGTLTRNDTSAGVVGATVNFSVDGGAAIPATTGAGGIATFTTYNPSALSVGPHNVGASFTAATISGTSFVGSTSGTLPLTVAQKTVTATVTASNKTYDRTNAATITGCSLSGVLAGDIGNVTCSAAGPNTFTDANVGNAKTVTATGITLSGSAAGNYTLNGVTTATTTANITTAALTATLTAANKTYDSTTAEPDASMSCSVATVFTGDTVNCAATSGTFNSSQVAAANQVTATVTISGASAGNYTLGAAGTSTNSTSAMATAHITTAALTATLTAANKIYDSTATEPNANMSCSVATVFTGDTVNCAATNGTFNSSQVAAANQVTATVTISGASAGNYTLGAAGTSTSSTSAMATGHITTAALTATLTAANKTYDSTTTEPNANMSCSVATVFTGDMVNCAATSGNFNSLQVAIANEVTATVTISGASAGNYTLGAAGTSTNSTSAMATAHITTAALTATLTAANKTYDSTATEPNANMSCSVATVFTGDTVNCAATNGTFNSSQVATANQVTATVTISGASAGNYTLGAAGTTLNSTSATASAHINPAPTSTSVSSSANPSTYGQSLTFTATVSNTQTSAIPTGAVQFVVDGSNFGSPVALVAGSATSGATSTLTVSGSPHTVAANYVNSDGNFNNSNGTLAGGQVVNKADTSTAVSSSQNPSTFGQSVTFTATVSNTQTSATPTGSVQFVVDGTNFGSPVALVAGSATSGATSTLTVSGSPHTVAANYVNSDGNFNNSNGTLAGGQVVNKANTSTAVSSSQNPSTFGQSVTFTATVSNTQTSAIPTGSVQFVVDGSNFGSPVALVAGSATSGATSTLTVSGSPHTVAANYVNSDGNFNNSNGTLASGQVVNKANTSTAVSSSQNPSTFGQSVTFTVTVSNTQTSAIPTGAVQFVVDGSNFGSPVALVAGSATSGATSTLTVSGSPHTVAANYVNSDGNFNNSMGSLAGGQAVKPAPTSTSVSSSANPSTYGQSVTFTATVMNTAGAGVSTATPTGSVQFVVDGSDFGSPVPVAGSGATATAMSMSTTTLSVGPHSVVAAYTNGDGNFVGSTSSTLTQQVNYGFLGLQSPYMPPPTTFNVKRTMPLKWQYTNSGGSVVNSAAANPVVTIQGPYACGGTDGAGNITVNDAGASGYQYDPTSNTWQFNWQIKGNMPGCYDIYIKSQQSGQTNGAYPISVVNQ